MNGLQWLSGSYVGELFWIMSPVVFVERVRGPGLWRGFVLYYLQCFHTDSVYTDSLVAGLLQGRLNLS